MSDQDNGFQIICSGCLAAPLLEIMLEDDCKLTVILIL